jgi:hypothetical protein
LLVPAILIIGYTLIVLPEDIVLFLSKYCLTRPLALRADRRIRRGHSLVMLCLLCFIIPFDLTRWWLSYGVGTDNAYQQLAVYAESHLPADASLNASGDVFKFEYFFPTRSISTANTPQNAESQDIHYFVVVPKDVLLHYGNITPDFAEWVVTHGQLLFTAYGSSYGEVSLYRVDYASNTQPPYASERHFPPADGEYVSGLLTELALWGLIVTGLVVGLGWRKTRRSFVHVPGAAVTRPVQANTRARGAAVTQPMEAKRERA